jgi:hypothetical protein
MKRSLRSKVLGKTATVGLALACAGCVLHVNRNLPPPTGFAYSPGAAADPVFSYEPAGSVQLSEPTDSTRTHDIVGISFPSSGRNGHPQNLVEGQYFRSRDSGAKKLVVVMPIWGTSTYPPAKISSGYARRAGKDTQVIWIYGTAPLFPWDELSTVQTEAEFVAMAHDSAERYRASVVDMRRLIDWAETRPEIERVANRVRRLQHERARDGDTARQRAACESRGAHDGRSELRGHIRNVPRPRRRSEGSRDEDVRLVARPVPRVLPRYFRARRPDEVRRALCSRENPDDRRDVRRLHARVVASRALGSGGPPEANHDALQASHLFLFTHSTGPELHARKIYHFLDDALDQETPVGSPAG